MGNALLGVEALGAALERDGGFSLTGGLLMVWGRSLSAGASSAAEQAKSVAPAARGNTAHCLIV